MLLLALALAPGIIISLFIYLKDRYNREPLRHLLVSFFLGVVIAIPAVIIELFGDKLLDNFVAPGFFNTVISAFIVIAFTEEYCKYIVLRWYAFRKKDFDEPLDGIVYSVFVAMGFATIENIGYVFQHGMGTGWLRMFLSVPAHASFAVLMGYYTGLSKFNIKKGKSLRIKGIFLAVLFHGLFDCFLFLSQNKALDGYISAGFLILGALVSYIIGVRFSLKAIRKHRNLSKENHEKTSRFDDTVIRPASFNDIPFIQEIARLTWPVAYKEILSPEQLEYMLDSFYSTESLHKQIENGHHFFIALKDFKPSGFAAFNHEGNQIYKLQKLYVNPNIQQSGIGRHLLQTVEKTAFSMGGKTMQLNVNRHNKATSFYEKNGYSITKEVDIPIGNGYFMNDYIMEKSL